MNKNCSFFDLEKLFNIYTGGDLILSRTELGEFPVISHTYKNNGISKRVSKIENRKLFDCKRTISLADRGTFKAFVQPENFYIGTRVKALELKDEYNAYFDKKILMYLTVIINMESYRFCYGRNACDRINYLKIKLPSIMVDGETVPDFNLMRRYINNLWIESNDMSKIPNYFLEDGYEKACWYIDNFDIELFEKKYKPCKKNQKSLKTNYAMFNISDIFIVKGTKTTKKDILETYGEGTWPYITTRSTNNGVDGYYNYYTEDGNVITIDSATIGFASYQQKAFSASDHVEKLIPKFKLNSSIAMYIITVLKQELFRYDYGRKFNQNRIKKTKILLPSIDGTNNIESLNLKYMDEYINSLPYSSCL